MHQSSILLCLNRSFRRGGLCKSCISVTVNEFDLDFAFQIWLQHACTHKVTNASKVKGLFEFRVLLEVGFTIGQCALHASRAVSCNSFICVGWCVNRRNMKIELQNGGSAVGWAMSRTLRPSQTSGSGLIASKIDWKGTATVFEYVCTWYFYGRNVDPSSLLHEPISHLTLAEWAKAHYWWYIY